MKAFSITHCRECFSEDIRWDCSVKSNNYVQDGRLKYSELATVFWLGCNNCSETLVVIGEDSVLEYLNNIQGPF